MKVYYKYAHTLCMNPTMRAHTIITCLMTNANHIHVQKSNAFRFTKVFFAFAKQQIKIDICLIECFKTDFKFGTTIFISFMYVLYIHIICINFTRSFTESNGKCIALLLSYFTRHTL